MITKLIVKLQDWWVVRRHLVWARRHGFVVLSVEENTAHCHAVDELARWVNESGALNDGQMPSHTKKRIVSLARRVVATLAWPYTVEKVTEYGDRKPCKGCGCLHDEAHNAA